MKDRQFTVQGVATELGVTPQAIRKAIKEKRLKAVKWGRDWAINFQDVLDFKERQVR